LPYRFISHLIKDQISIAEKDEKEKIKVDLTVARLYIFLYF